MLKLQKDLMTVFDYSGHWEIILNVQDCNYDYYNFQSAWQEVRNQILDKKVKNIVIDLRNSEKYFTQDSLEFLKTQKWFRDEILNSFEKNVQKMVFLVHSQALLKPIVRSIFFDTKINCAIYQTPKEVIMFLEKIENRASVWFYLNFLESYLQNSVIYRLINLSFKAVVVLYIGFNLFQDQIFEKLNSCERLVLELSKKIELLEKKH